MHLFSVDHFQSSKLEYITAADKGTDPCSLRLYVLTVELLANKKILFHVFGVKKNFFWKIFLTLLYATFPCGHYNVKKTKKKNFFAHEKLKKKRSKKLLIIGPNPFFSTLQPRLQPTAQN